MKSVDADGPFDGANELSNKLAHSRAVKDCMALQWFRFALGRVEGQLAGDSCTLEQIRARFAESNGDPRELIIALTRTDAFRFRPKIVAEPAP
jgi:hypothetical protein